MTHDDEPRTVSAEGGGGATPPVRIVPWPSELPLFVLALVVSLALWAAIILSIFGAIYGAMLAVFFFFAHLLLVTHIRGSGVRLGAEQFPELHARVLELSRRAGLDPPPAAYLLESGGVLNAFATKWFRGRILVLYSDLLTACEGDEAARDMVIGHEIGHHKAGHLEWIVVLAPAMFVPFLGASYSRAREYTCDRWGAVLCGDPAGAARGLAVLAAGGRYGRRLNPRAFAAQRDDLDTGWMTIGRWLSAYPPLSARLEAVSPELQPTVAGRPLRGPLRAAGILAGCLAVPMGLGLLTALLWMPALNAFLAAANPNAAGGRRAREALDPVSSSGPRFATEQEVDAARSTALADLERLASAAEVWLEAGGEPNNEPSVAELWAMRYPGEPLPRDPFDGGDYGFIGDEEELLFWSVGPDGETATEDDLDRRVAVTTR